MTYSNSKKWVLLSVLAAGVISAILLLSVKMEAAAGAYASENDSFHDLRQTDDSGSGVDGVNTITLPQTIKLPIFLPLVGLKMGAPPPLFGVQMYGTVNQATGITKVVEAGARWVRVPFSWASVEPDNRTPDQYHWTAIDRNVQALTQEGIEPLLTLIGNPKWAATYPMGPVYRLADLQEFIGAVVERFDGDGHDDAPGSPVVTYWEIYNEPDNTSLWHAEEGWLGMFGYHGDEYAALLDAIYPVVKASSPKAQVVFGGVAHDNFDYEGGPFDPGFIDDVLSHCTGPCFDVMNFHYYPFFRIRWETYGSGIMGKANRIRSKLANHGLDRPLMCTETSWPSATTWGSDVLQSRFVVATFVRGMADGLVTQIWWPLKDVSTGLNGILDRDLNPKPSYHAYQTLTTQIGRVRDVRPLSVGETGGGNIEGYSFRVPGPDNIQRVDVLWYDCPQYLQKPPADCPAGVSQTMVVPAQSLLITDMYGNSGIVDDASDGVVDGHVAIQVRPNPIYVTHVSPSN